MEKWGGDGHWGQGSLNPSAHASVTSKAQTRNTHKRRHESRKGLWGKKGHSRKEGG